MSKFLEANSWDSNKMGNYSEKIKPFPNSNLTLLDAWVYANGDVFDSLGPFKEFVDSLPIDALKSCDENQNGNWKEQHKNLDKI